MAVSEKQVSDLDSKASELTPRTLAMSKRRSVFTAMMATRANITNRNHSISPVSNTAAVTIVEPPTVTIETPNSASQFKRVNVPSITGIGNQVWRRVKESNVSSANNVVNRSTSPNEYGIKQPKSILKVPNLTELQKV